MVGKLLKRTMPKTKTNIIEEEIEKILKHYELDDIGINIGGVRKDLVELFSRQKEESKKVVEERLEWLERDATSDGMIPIFQVKRVFAYILKALEEL